MPFNKLKRLLNLKLNRLGDKCLPTDKQNIEEQCNVLLTKSGEITGKQTAGEILTNYNTINQARKINFFNFLVEKLGLDSKEVGRFSVQYEGQPTKENFNKLVSVVEPPRLKLHSRPNQVENVTANLVPMRADLLELIKDHEAFERTNIKYKQILHTRFSRIFLDFQQIDWETPANILVDLILKHKKFVNEKLIEPSKAVLIFLTTFSK